MLVGKFPTNDGGGVRQPIQSAACIMTLSISFQKSDAWTRPVLAGFFYARILYHVSKQAAAGASDDVVADPGNWRFSPKIVAADGARYGVAANLPD
jgi:hypothetical protein